MSRTLSAKACARSAYAGSSASSSAYSFIVEPQPAALTTTHSTPRGLEGVDERAGESCASSSRPLCTDSAPQQPWRRGTTTSQPSACSTRAVAALTPGKNAPCTQPVSSPTVARRVPVGRGCAPAAARACPSRGARLSIAARWGASRRAGRYDAAPGRARCAWRPRSGPRSSRSRRGCGNSAKIRPRSALSCAERSWWRSTWARVCSISVSYCTPDGHAVTQAMQPRQASQWPTIESVIGSPSRPSFIR